MLINQEFFEYYSIYLTVFYSVQYTVFVYICSVCSLWEILVCLILPHPGNFNGVARWGQ